MTQIKNFPLHLLVASNESRLEYFNDYIAVHPAMEAAMKNLDEMASGLLDQRLILLLGAAGVGKSELLKLFIRRRISQRVEQMTNDPQRVPGIFIELEAPVTGSFSFVPFYKEALATLGCVLPGKTLGFVDRLAGRSVLRSIHIEAAGRKPSGEDLKARFTDSLMERKVEICGLDEAVNAFKSAVSLSEQQRDRIITDQANKIKSMVNKSQTTFALVGAFDFYQLTVGSAQLARRSQIVHLQPYGSTEKDLVGFLVAFTDLLSQLPIEHDIDPSLHATEVFLQCLGCIGNLKNILKTALNKALLRRLNLTIELVRESFFSAPSLLKMKDEQEAGVAGLNLFLSLEELADCVEKTPILITAHAKSEKASRNRLKPGETTPSHRQGAAKNWAE